MRVALAEEDKPKLSGKMGKLQQIADEINARGGEQQVRACARAFVRACVCARVCGHARTHVCVRAPFCTHHLVGTSSRTFTA